MNGPVADSQAPVHEPQNTSPLSILVGALQAAQNLIIPLLLVSFGSGGVALIFVLPGFVAILALITLFGYISWKRLTYTMGEQDIRVESGVLSRAARSVPYERIQDVSLEQKLIPRLLGLVSVKFETGAGGAEDLALAFLKEEAGEELRKLVRARRDAQESSPVGRAQDDESVRAEVDDEQADILFTMSNSRLVTFGLFSFSLAIFAVLGGLLQYADWFVDFEIWDADIWQGLIEEQGDAVSGLGPIAQAISAVGGVLALIAIGAGTGIARVFAREWEFRLERTARGFRRRRGLFTKTDVVMPIHRVQAVKVGTGALRYRFGWHRLRFVSLAQDAGSANHDVAPFAKMREIDPIVKAAGFRLPDDSTDWHRASENYRTDSMIIDSIFFVFAALIVGSVMGLLGSGWTPYVIAILLGLAVFSAAAALYSWKFKRHALDDAQIMARSGLLSPQSQIATRMKLHSVEISQGPIARRRGYATLNFGLAGGEFAIPGVPIDRARDVRSKVLETIAKTDFSELENA